MSTFEEQILAFKNTSNTAVVVPNGPILSYPRFLDVVANFKNDLAALSLQRQSAISLSLGNSLEFATAFIALTSSAFIACPLNPNYTQAEFQFYIEDVKSSLLLVPRGSVEKGTAAVQAARKFKTAIAEVYWSDSRAKIVLDLKEDGRIGSHHYSDNTSATPLDIAFILHTSGTTGRPKAVPLTHANMARTVTNVINTYKLTSSDCSYLVMPLFHVHGLLCGFLAPLGSGGSVIIADKFSASQFWDHFVRYRANWYTAVPTMHQILLKSPVPTPIPNIRFVRSCSSSLAPATFHELEKKLQAPVLEAYAMTEACHQMTSNNLPPGKRKPGTVGVGQGVEVVILDDNANVLPQGQQGEISIKGTNITPGYINNPKANAESFTHNGYFRTGDQGMFDEDGFLVITGRIKELINRGGEKISPIELDGVMLEHPAVAEAVAFGAPDELYGQSVNAVIVLKPGKENVTEEDIRTFLTKKLAKFKVPKRIYFAKVMPKTATGKIQRRIIAQKFTEEKPKAKL
jgi:oxalate---CoA ligase